MRRDGRRRGAARWRRGHARERGGSSKLLRKAVPDAAAPWREMAGLHALAQRLAGRPRTTPGSALTGIRGDPLASRILATALFLEDDPDGALDAWNRVGEPIVESGQGHGTRTHALSRSSRGSMALQPQTLLTRGGAAERRAGGSRSCPPRKRRASATVPEKTAAPRWTRSSSSVRCCRRRRCRSRRLALRAITDRELALGLASPSGGGEMWRRRGAGGNTGRASRWVLRRRRRSAACGASAFRERQTYASAGSTIEESRTRAGFHVSDWTRTRLSMGCRPGVSIAGATRAAPCR